MNPTLKELASQVHYFQFSASLGGQQILLAGICTLDYINDNDDLIRFSGGPSLLNLKNKPVDQFEHGYAMVHLGTAMLTLWADIGADHWPARTGT